MIWNVCIISIPTSWMRIVRELASHNGISDITALCTIVDSLKRWQASTCCRDTASFSNRIWLAQQQNITAITDLEKVFTHHLTVLLMARAYHHNPTALLCSSLHTIVLIPSALYFNAEPDLLNTFPFSILTIRYRCIGVLSWHSVFSLHC